MKVAYLVSDMDHAHNYGLDFLYAGFVAELGFRNVIDWPEKDCLHLPSMAARDDCSIDSDQCHPRKHPSWDEVLSCDLAIIANDPLAPDATFMAARCSRLPRSMPIAAIDASDRVENHRDFYEAVAGRPLAAYFKREYPIGATWPKTYACPLSYPASRVPVLAWGAKRGVFYHATDHGGGDPGIPRRAIVAGLIQCLSGSGEHEATALIEAETGVVRRLVDGRYDISLTRSQENRLAPEKYHARMAQALIGISWNGAPNFDSNRLHEHFAYGLAQVSEMPRIQFPVPPVNGIHAWFVRTPEEVAPAVWTLLHDEGRARTMAAQARAYHIEHDSSEARARYVLRILGATI